MPQDWAKVRGAGHLAWSPRVRHLRGMPSRATAAEQRPQTGLNESLEKWFMSLGCWDASPPLTKVVFSGKPLGGRRFQHFWGPSLPVCVLWARAPLPRASDPQCPLRNDCPLPVWMPGAATSRMWPIQGSSYRRSTRGHSVLPLPGAHRSAEPRWPQRHGEPLRPGAERGHSLAGGHLPRVTISSPRPGWDMKSASPREKVRGTVRSLQRNNDPNPQGRAVLCGKVGGTEGPKPSAGRGSFPEPAPHGLVQASVSRPQTRGGRALSFLEARVGS